MGHATVSACQARSNLKTKAQMKAKLQLNGTCVIQSCLSL
jgi:hypothetical protein